MKKDNMNKKLIFFSYQGIYNGNYDDNVESIRKGIQTYNNFQSSFEAKSWEDFRTSSAIDREILNAIDECEIFVGDLTYFNHNVLFELGYAIARNKKILVLLNEKIENAKARYLDSIFKVIRYTKLTNSNDIQRALQSKNYKGDLLNQLLKFDKNIRVENDIFYIQSRIPNQSSLDLTEYISELNKKNKFSVTIDYKSEVNYKPITYYILNILKHNCIIIHFLGKNVENYFIENANNSFYAGIACGINKKILLVAPSRFKAPLDYYEILVQYDTSEILLKSVNEWINVELKTTCNEELKKIEEHELNLIKLGIGDDVAENEGEELLNYFVDTASYLKAINSNKMVITGRKGSGKTAIFLKLIDDFLKDKLNYLIILKPESDEIEQNLEFSRLYAQTSKKTFFYSFGNY